MWASGLLLTSNENRDDYAIISINLEVFVEEEYPVVPLKLTVSYLETHYPVYNDPFVRRSFFNLPEENPLSEGGTFAKMTTGTTGNLRKIDPGYINGEPYESYAFVESTETDVRDTYFTASTFGPDSQAMIQTYRMGLSGQNPWGIADLYLQIQNPGTATPSYYRLRVNRGGGGWWTISRFDAGAETVLGSNNWGVGNGNWIMFRRAGNNLTAYELYYDWVPGPPESEDDPSDGPYGSQVLTVTDTDILEAGYTGFGTNHIGGMRNFFAGDALTDMSDDEEVYLNLTPKGREGIPGTLVQHTFPDLETFFEQWTLDIDGSDKHFYVSEKHATHEGMSLRVDHSTVYPIHDFFAQWIAADGGDNDKTYWITYAFMIENWKDVWRNGDGSLATIPLPGFAMVIDDLGYTFGEPSIKATSATTGQITLGSSAYGAGSPIALSDGVWHTVRLALKKGIGAGDGSGEAWLDGTQRGTATGLDLTGITGSPEGICCRGDSSGHSAIVYYDDMNWRMTIDPGEPADTELSIGNTTEQWVKIREKENGPIASVGMELDPNYADTVPEAWLYSEIFIPQSLLDNLGSGEETYVFFIDCDAVWIRIHNTGSAYQWRAMASGSGTAVVLTTVQGNRWYRIQIHYNVANGSDLQIWIDDQRFDLTVPSPAGGVNYIAINNPTFFTTPDRSSWIGVDNMAWSTEGPVNEYFYDEWWRFEGQDPLGDANINHPTPAWFAYFGPGAYVTTTEEGGYGPGPGLPEGFVKIALTPDTTEEVSLSTFGEVYLDLVSISGGTYVDGQDTPIPLVLTVLGGECFSTWSGDNVGLGDASLRWIGRDSLRWSSEQDLRWSQGEVSTGETIHC